ncbi:DUF3106 domain-containing protein [Vibrio maritimus]|uniref:DUF3106 domain-containing protein n=1 Tax=Vibrio maritimus TaxID=990268 RepID=UPI001F293EE7|nr:DUF3106 domain-containing protein [Vibrio maritimus]
MKLKLISAVIAASFLAGCSSSGSSNGGDSGPAPQEGFADVTYLEGNDFDGAYVSGDQGDYDALILRGTEGVTAVYINGQIFTVENSVVYDNDGNKVGDIQTKGNQVAIVNENGQTLVLAYNNGRLSADVSGIDSSPDFGITPPQFIPADEAVRKVQKEQLYKLAIDAGHDDLAKSIRMSINPGSATDEERANNAGNVMVNIFESDNTVRQLYALSKITIANGDPSTSLLATLMYDISKGTNEELKGNILNSWNSVAEKLARFETHDSFDSLASAVDRVTKVTDEQNRKAIALFKNIQVHGWEWTKNAIKEGIIAGLDLDFGQIPPEKAPRNLTPEQRKEIAEKVRSLSQEQRQQIKQAVKDRVGRS